MCTLPTIHFTDMKKLRKVIRELAQQENAGHGQLQSPRSLRDAIRAEGRLPAQRDTKYRLLRQFEASDASGAG